MNRQDVTRAELVGIKLMRASEAIQGAARDLFKSRGLSEPQYNVLRILRGAGAAGLRCQEISDRMIKRVPDITRLLDRLVDKRLVERRRSETDRRVVISVLTEEGRALLADIDAPLRKQVRRNFASLDEARISRLDGLLDDLLAGLETDR